MYYIDYQLEKPDLGTYFHNRHEAFEIREFAGGKLVDEIVDLAYDRSIEGILMIKHSGSDLLLLAFGIVADNADSIHLLDAKIKTEAQPALDIAYAAPANTEVRPHGALALQIEMKDTILIGSNLSLCTGGIIFKLHEQCRRIIVRESLLELLADIGRCADIVVSGKQTCHTDSDVETTLLGKIDIQIAGCISGDDTLYKNVFQVNGFAIDIVRAEIGNGILKRINLVRNTYRICAADLEVTAKRHSDSCTEAFHHTAIYADAKMIDKAIATFTLDFLLLNYFYFFNLLLLDLFLLLRLFGLDHRFFSGRLDRVYNHGLGCKHHRGILGNVKLLRRNACRNEHQRGGKNSK